MQALTITQSKLALRHAYPMAKLPHNDFSQRLKALIEEKFSKDVPQKDLATRFGCSGGMVSFMLSGQRLPAMDLAIRMAIELDCCVDYLLTGRGAKRPISVADEETLIKRLAMFTPQDLHHCAAIIHALGDKVATYQVTRDE